LVDFKIAVLVFQCLTGQAPGYLAEDCQLVADVSTRRLRSADTATCVTRRTSNIFGDRCFAAAGPRLWNSLPINLRQCHSLEQFKRLLKTFLFSAWSHGALWHLPKSAPYLNLLTYLLTYLLFTCHTIRYDSVYLTCSKKLTGSQLSPPHGTNKKIKNVKLKIKLKMWN